jgi:RHS repeat-associated protein
MKCEGSYQSSSKLRHPTLPTCNTLRQAQGNAFTGQYSYVSDDATDLGSSGFGLMFYNARWYDPSLGRMAQADTIVPGGVQGLDRYAYVNNSPLNYVDPSGHMPTCGEEKTGYACKIRLSKWFNQVVTHTVYLGGFYAEIESEEYSEDGGNPHKITNKYQRAMVLLDLFLSMLPPEMHSPNVKIFLSYDQYEDGRIDNVNLKIINESGATVYVPAVKITITRPMVEYGFACVTCTPTNYPQPVCEECGEYYPNSLNNFVVKPGETQTILLCSNCWANSGGIVSFLPLPNGSILTMAIHFYIPNNAMENFARFARVPF